MIKLNISSNIDISQTELTTIFIDKKIKCQITKTLSTVTDSYGHFKIENGYSILIFDIDGITFKNNIWDTLKTLLKLECAFVKYKDNYMGCILNCPDVFTKSNCPSNYILS
jgi:hypothetical protein